MRSKQRISTGIRTGACKLRVRMIAGGGLGD